MTTGGSSAKYVSKLVHEHPREQCKVVIGPRGVTISALREASGCAIKVADRTYASDQLVPGTLQMQTITYSGSEAHVQAAVRMVSDLLTNGTVPAAAAAAVAAAAAPAAAGGDELQTTLQAGQ